MKLTDERFHSISKALADPRRFDFVRRIGKAGDTLACEHIRTTCCDVTPATLSHHMKELETAGLVESTREGKFVTYRLRRDVLQAYLAEMAKI
ncbi:MAG TPA: metalloregulator ArsR/SmtB family transcription factor [Acidobacteriaceae bacterium]